jgi:hypothetical protein
MFWCSKKESIPKELLDAFKAMDVHRRGAIPARDLWNILVKWGEKLSPREGNPSKHATRRICSLVFCGTNSKKYYDDLRRMGDMSSS